MAKNKLKLAFPFWNWLKNQLKDTPVCEFEVICIANQYMTDHFPERSVTKRIWHDLKIDKVLGEIKGKIELDVKFDVPAECIHVDIKPLSVFGNVVTANKPIQSYHIETFAKTITQTKYGTTYSPNTWHRVIVHYSLMVKGLFDTPTNS